MTGPLWLLTIVTVSTLAAIYSGPCTNGAHAATHPGTLRLPPKGLARLFYLLGLRITQRRLARSY